MARARIDYARCSTNRRNFAAQRTALVAARQVKPALGATLYDPAEPMGRMLFNVLATFAEFDSDLIRLRTRGGVAIARSKGKLRGKQPKLSDRQQRELRRMRDTGDYSISDLAELLTVSRPTVYRTLARTAPARPQDRPKETVCAGVDQTGQSTVLQPSI